MLAAFMMIFSSFFFFKQKTAYEMRISDWSSDVCSSDLPCGGRSPARTPGGNGTMKDFTAMNRKYLAAAAAIVLVAGGTGYLLMDGDESAPGGEQAAAPSSATEAAPPSRIEMSADRIKMAEIGRFKVGDAGLGSEIIAQGSVEAPPSGLAVLTAGDRKSKRLNSSH